MGLPDGFWGGAGSAAVASGGGIIGSALSYHDAQQARKWQERMARNAVTYRVEDLKRAGINPILAAGAGLGGGLSTPSTAVANPGDFGASAGVQALHSGKRVALESAMNKQQLVNLRNQNRLMDQQVSKVALENATSAQELQYISQKMAFLRTKEGREAFHRSLVAEGKPGGAASVEWAVKGLSQLWDSIPHSAREQAMESVISMVMGRAGGEANSARDSMTSSGMSRRQFLELLLGEPAKAFYRARDNYRKHNTNVDLYRRTFEYGKQGYGRNW